MLHALWGYWHAVWHLEEYRKKLVHINDKFLNAMVAIVMTSMISLKSAIIQNNLSNLKKQKQWKPVRDKNVCL